MGFSEDIKAICDQYGIKDEVLTSTNCFNPLKTRLQEVIARMEASLERAIELSKTDKTNDTSLAVRMGRVATLYYWIDELKELIEDGTFMETRCGKVKVK